VQRLFGVHAHAAEIVAEARLPRVILALGAFPSALAALALGHAQRLFGKLSGTLFASVPGLTLPKRGFGLSRALYRSMGGRR